LIALSPPAPFAQQSSPARSAEQRRRGFWVWLPLVLTAALLAPDKTVVGADSAALAAALNTITTDELRSHVEYLAGDTFEGREAGARGGRAAGVYVEEYFSRHHLTPAGAKGSYYQPFGSGHRNILGLLEGSDPELREEVILVGAHYDHVGYGNAQNSNGPVGYIHNGADDNASGIAGLLETIEALTSLPQAPRRSILFVAWDAEEKGLLGSYYWLEHPTIPLDRVVLAINSDMIGRLRKQRLEMYGTRTTAGLRELIARQNVDQNILIDFTWEMKDDSDHWPFFIRNIPSIMFHTGLHDDYHRPSDDPERVNNDGMYDVTRLLVRTVDAAADAPVLNDFRPRSRNEGNSQRVAAEAPLAPPPGRLGIDLGGEDGEVGRVWVDRVRPGSPAAAAGLRAGDRLFEINGQEIQNIDQLIALVWLAPEESRLAIERAGADPELFELPIRLKGPPIRLGISWREDPAEPQAVTINRVIRLSPADRAGLRVADRVYSVNGQRFANADSLKQLLDQIPGGPCEFEIERQGQVSTVTLDLPPLADEPGV
jgi:hypothetical protein